MKSVYKILIGIFTVAAFGLIITAFQNCGGQQPSNSLCFGTNCSQTTSSSTGGGNPTPQPTSPVITISSTNLQKITLPSSICVPNSGDPACAIMISLIYGTTPGRILFVTGGPTGGAQGAATLATCTGNAETINYSANYISSGYTYVFWLFESNTCPVDSAASANAFFSANQANPAAKLTVQRTY